MIPPQRFDWWQLITDLERAGVSHERIAAECLRSKAWVANLKNTVDAEPRCHDGLMLVALWTEHCGATGKPAPVLVVQQSVRNV